MKKALALAAILGAALLPSTGNTATATVVDECRNLPGIQTVVPAGYVQIFKNHKYCVKWPLV